MSEVQSANKLWQALGSARGLDGFAAHQAAKQSTKTLQSIHRLQVGMCWVHGGHFPVHGLLAFYAVQYGADIIVPHDSCQYPLVGEL